MAVKEFKLHDPLDFERGPFQASKEDYEATRRRKALCLKNFMIIVERFALNPVTKEMIAIAVSFVFLTLNCAVSTGSNKLLFSPA